MKNSTAPNRKTGRMIAKNLIVLFAVALAGFAAFRRGLRIRVQLMPTV